MAVIRKKEKREVPAIGTSSLPDVVFMILFFFMATSTMREQELLVQYKLPEATEIQKLEKKSLVSYIHIGPPSRAMRQKFGDTPRIQLNDTYRTAADIGQFIASERDKLGEADRPFMMVSLKADQATRMGVVTDVKQELRRAEALKVTYVATKAAQGL
ncbi:MAG: biopolymer transporter ExbD [Rikenellaceae bacterium]|jgi:biopolymer transport protein ExbD|nr:biopolymer transporter ExbD [Rikenellaceae bacterium]